MHDPSFHRLRLRRIHTMCTDSCVVYVWGDPGYQIQTDEEITASDTATDEQLANGDDEEDENLKPDIRKLKQIREAINLLINYM